MEGRCQCKAGCDPHVVQCQSTWWYSGMPLVFTSKSSSADWIETKDRVGCIEDERVPSGG
jgi:hypothetical protein